MSRNPYQPGDVSTAAPRTRATRWMVWAGAVSLLLAVICLIATVVATIWSFNAVSTSSSTAEPSDLAKGISEAFILPIAAAPLALVGLILLVLGFGRRQPVDET